MPVKTAASLVREMFPAQNLRPSWVKDLDFHTLPGHYRMLLVNDGSTQALVMAQALEPLVATPTAKPLGQDTRMQYWMTCEDKDIKSRYVAIKGRTTNRTYLTAEALYVPARLPDGMASLLEAGILSVGEAVRNFTLETNRQLLWYGRTPDHPVVRGYRIMHKGYTLFAIVEKFS